MINRLFPGPKTECRLTGTLLTMGLLVMVTGCATTPANRREGPTQQLSDQAVRYGSMAGAGAAGYFAGKEIGGNNTSGAVGATVGVLAAYGLNKFADHREDRAYQNGRIEGADSARAEIVNEAWRREAVYGLPGPDSPPGRPTYREVYVPSREINGVRLQGEYQTVELLK